MESELDSVERALAQFYRTNQTLQAEAHRYLTEVQMSPKAWGIVWDLLRPERSGEAQFFAATTLNTKLMKSWSEVPENEYENLRRRILEAIVAYSSGPEIVLNRLCIALATYLIQTTPHHWNRSFDDILAIFQPENLPSVPPDRVIWILLEILTVIPEELSTVVVTPNERNLVRSEMEKATPKVMSFLESLIGSSDFRDQASKTLSSWLPVVTSPLPYLLELIRRLVDIVISLANDHSESCENELEAITLILTSSHHQYQPQAVLRALEIILRLRDIAYHSDNKELVVNVYRLVISAAETHCHLLLTCFASGDPSKINISTELLRLLLKCTTAPGTYPIEDTQSNLTFPFWYMLQDVLMTLGETEMGAATPYVVPVYEELCRALLYKARQPPDGVRLNASDKELVRIYRQDIADTIVACYFIVRHYLISLLTSTLASAKTWQEIEAVLYIVFVLAETTWTIDDGEDADDDDDGRVSSAVAAQAVANGQDLAGSAERSAVMSLLLNVPPSALSHKQVVITLNQAIGAYSEWWIGHSDVLGRLIPTLVASFEDPETAVSATMALKDITRECTTSIAPFASSLLDSCQNALRSGTMGQAECIRLMYPVGRLLSVLPYEETLSKLGPIVEELSNGILAALSSSSGIGPEEKAQTVYRLRMLTGLMASLYLAEKAKIEPPTLLVLERLLPVYSALLRSCSNDSVITIEIPKSLRAAIVNLMDSSERLLGPVVDIAVAGYAANPNSASLDLARQIFVLFGKSETSSGLVVNLLRSLTEKTLSLVIGRTNGGSESGDVLQSYFGLAGAVAKKNTPLVRLSLQPEQLFNLGIHSLSLPENSTAKAAASMLCSFISLSREDEVLVQIVQNSGEMLVETTLKCIATESPRGTLEVFADLLLILNKRYTDYLSRWLNYLLLTRESFPSPRLSVQQKAQFTKTVLRERSNRRKLVDVVNEFALICRSVIAPSSAVHLQLTPLP